MTVASWPTGCQLVRMLCDVTKSESPFSGYSDYEILVIRNVIFVSSLFSHIWGTPFYWKSLSVCSRVE